MYVQRKTINANVSITGIGRHSGIYPRVELYPAPAGNGIQFVRADLDGLRIPALQASTTALEYATTVGKDDVSVGTVEHLPAPLNACPPAPGRPGGGWGETSIVPDKKGVMTGPLRFRDDFVRHKVLDLIGDLA